MDRSLHILIFSKEYLALTETFIQTALLELAERNDVSMLCTHRYNESSYYFSRVIEVPYKIPFLLRKITGLCWQLQIPVKRWYSTAFSAELARKINWPAWDIIHCHFGYKSLLLIDNLPVAVRGSVPIFITFHGYDASSKLKASGAYRKRLRDLFRQPNIFPLFVSEALRKQAARYGLESANSKVIYLGIDIDKFRRTTYPTAETGKTFLQIASFREKKGQVYTIRAFHRFTQSHGKGHRLILVGEGPQRATAERLIASLGIERQVHFAGACPPDAVPHWLNQAHIYVHHSVTSADGDTEGLPISIMEAMAMELPVLATYHAGIPELVEDGINGILSPERDIVHMADAMERMLDWAFLPSNREKIQRSFSKEAHGRQLEECYRRAIS